MASEFELNRSVKVLLNAIEVLLCDQEVTDQDIEFLHLLEDTLSSDPLFSTLEKLAFKVIDRHMETRLRLIAFRFSTRVANDPSEIN